MTLAEVLGEVWRAVLVDGRSSVHVGGVEYTVGRTRSAGLRTVSFRYEGRLIDGIEQNPEKASRWAQLAQSGQRILQFSCEHRYFANICEGALTRYPAWRSLQLPD